MQPQKYITHLLTLSATHALTEDEKTLLKINKINTKETVKTKKRHSKKNIEKFIYAKLTSKQFRKTKMDPECVVRTQKAISTKVQKDEPIELFFPQGGYKLWRFPSSPTADWAEFFNIAYLLEYVAPIAQAYKPGVHITYYMHTLLMELHDNLTTQEIQAYVDSFEQLLETFRQYMPENMSISILRDADIYERDEYFLALEKGKSTAEVMYKTLPKERKEHLARMAHLNIKWDGAEDWTTLSQKEKDEKIYLAGLYEMAATSQLPRVFEIVKNPHNVLAFTVATKDFIGIGSTKASLAKHWVGFGVLQEKPGKTTNTTDQGYLPVILTPTQYQSALKQKHKKIAINVIPQKNFEEIMVFKEPFSFAKKILKK